MPFFSRWSIRTLLIFLVAISILPALGIIFYSGIEQRHLMAEEIKKTSFSLMQAIANRQQVITENSRQFLVTLSGMPEVQRLDGQACNALFRRLLPENPVYANISLFSREGIVVSSAVPSKPVNLSDRKHFRDAISTRGFSTGEYVISRIFQRPIFSFAYPVLGRNGEVKGVLVVPLDLSRYDYIIADAKLPEKSIIVLTDHKGARLYRYPEGDKYIGLQVATELMKPMIEGSDEGTFIEKGVDDIRRIYSYKKFRLSKDSPPYLYLRLGIPEESSTAEIWSVTRRNLIILGTVFALALASAWYVGNYLIANPIKSLVHFTERFRRGEENIATGLSHAGNELGQLAEAFDKMIIDLRDREDKRRQAEEEREQLQERLHRAEKMESLGTLAGGVAHDLNNVLGVLVGYSELLMQQMPEDSPLHRHAARILNGGQRAAAIINDLLTLTRRGVSVSEVVNMNRVITGFLQMPEFEAVKIHHPAVTFRTSLDPELLNMKGSTTHRGKAVMNLLSNAAEAITGTGEVLIRTENRYLDKPIHGYDTTKEGKYVVLIVSDTGSGISPADMGKIFEPFYTKKVMGRSGTGLGLSVVWGTVKDHDGYIDVESREGKGTTFTLYFPVTREALTKVEEAVPQSTYMGRGEHILVVDDVEGQRLLASTMLEGLGYRVDSVASGEEAIEFIKNQPVDLLILDMIMNPGIDGLETYEKILQIRKGQKALIVSGFAVTERVKKAQAIGAGSYVKKPYVMEKLGLAVRNELDRR